MSLYPVVNIIFKKKSLLAEIVWIAILKSVVWYNNEHITISFRVTNILKFISKNCIFVIVCTKLFFFSWLCYEVYVMFKIVDHKPCHFFRRVNWTKMILLNTRVITICILKSRKKFDLLFYHCMSWCLWWCYQKKFLWLKDGVITKNYC